MNITRKNILSLALLITAILPITISEGSIKIGDDYNAVVRELGAPDGEISLGSKQILTYGDAKVTLRDQSVVEISSGFEALIAERADKQKEIQAKRDANLINFRGQWMTPEKKDRIINAENKKRAQNNASQANTTWLTNFDQASKLAKSENKKLLLNFTGSDWCGWCIKLDNEVFSKAEFKQYAQQYYILVKLDFPKKEKLSAQLKKQNNALAKRYDVKGFPSIVVLTPSGKYYTKGGYVKGGPNAFIRSIL